MLTDYICDDVLQYILNEYISHHPEDIEIINTCVRDNFKFNVGKYTYVKYKEESENSNGHYWSQNTCESYIDGLIVQRTTYHSKGHICKKISYKNGLRHGEYIHYNCVSKILEKSVYYKNQLHGKYTLYYSFGKLLEEGTYVYGHKNGVYTTYSYPDRDEGWYICITTEYKMGMVHGIQRSVKKYDTYETLKFHLIYENGKVVRRIKG
jgi:antitoxin component YwqK of YwqJK toxin-antitoxin module